MSDETRRVRRGDTVTVRIADDSDQPTSGQQEEATATSRGMAPDDAGDDDVLAFKKKTITFYDLGTRLRSVPNPGTFDRLRRLERSAPIETDPHDGYYNEYVELDLEKGKNINSFGLTLGEIAPIEAELLRGDPLGHSAANGSGRTVPNAMQLPYESEWLYLDVTVGSKKVALSQPDKRPFLSEPPANPPRSSPKWKKKDVDLSEERWNPLNISAGLVGSPGSLKTGSGKLKVDCAAHYEALDTDDARFKWTNDPSFAAAGVDAPSLSGNTRVFLRPRVQHTSFGYVIQSNTGGLATPGQAQVLTRLPMYPLVGKLIRIPITVDGNRLIITRGFARAGSASLERSTILPVDRTAEETSDLAIIGGSSFIRHTASFAYTGGMGFDFRSQPVIQGMLLGIVDTGNKTYYAWAASDYNPTSRRAFIVGDPSVSFVAGASLPAPNWQCPPVRLYTGADDDQTTTANPARLYQT
jgi:hypothetical protein